MLVSFHCNRFNKRTVDRVTIEKNARFFSPVVYFCRLSAGMKKPAFPLTVLSGALRVVPKIDIILKRTVFLSSFYLFPEFGTDLCLPIT